MMDYLLFKYSFKKNNIWNNYEQLLNNEHLSKEDIKALQMKKIKKLLAAAQEHSPYYKEVFARQGIDATDINSFEDFKNIPILFKQDLKVYREQLKLRDVHDSDLVMTGTGGSTGVPTQFYLNKHFIRMTDALKYRNLNWTGWKHGEWRFFLWGSAFDVSKGEEARNKIINRIKKIKFYPAFRLTQDMIRGFVDDIKRLKPTIIEGYNMPLYIVAKHLIDNGISFDHKLKGVINCAETLYPEARNLIETGFGCKVFNKYGGRELSDICYECQCGNMHINEDLVYVEIVDDNGEKVHCGETGHIILTGLENYGTPFIRYKIEDMGVLKPYDGTCECGLNFSIMEDVKGRSQDIIRLKNGKYLAGEFFPHLFKDFDLVKFQVVQEKIDLIKVCMVKGPGFSNSDEQYLKKMIKAYVPGTDVRFIYTDDIPAAASGKYRFTVSLLDH